MSVPPQNLAGSANDEVALETAGVSSETRLTDLESAVVTTIAQLEHLQYDIDNRLNQQLQSLYRLATVIEEQTRVVHTLMVQAGSPDTEPLSSEPFEPQAEAASSRHDDNSHVIGAIMPSLSEAAPNPFRDRLNVDDHDL